MMPETAMKSDARSRAFRRWHMIGELDLIGLMTSHAMLWRNCEVLGKCVLNLPDDDAGIEAALEDLLGTLLSHDQHAQPVMQILLDAEHGPATATALSESILRGYRNCIAKCLYLLDLPAAPLDPRIDARSDLQLMLTNFIDDCRLASTFEMVTIRYLANTRLTSEARAMLDGRLSRFTGPGDDEFLEVIAGFKKALFKQSRH